MSHSSSQVPISQLCAPLPVPVAARQAPEPDGRDAAAAQHPLAVLDQRILQPGRWGEVVQAVCCSPWHALRAGLGRAMAGRDAVLGTTAGRWLQCVPRCDSSLAPTPPPGIVRCGAPTCRTVPAGRRRWRACGAGCTGRAHASGPTRIDRTRCAGGCRLWVANRKGRGGGRQW